MSDADKWGDPEPFGEDEDGDPVLWNCPNPDCSTQKDTKAKAAAHCANEGERTDIDADASAERDETPRVDADKTTVQNGYYQQNGLVDMSTTLGRLDVDGLPSAQCLGNHDFIGWYRTRPETDVETIEDGFDGRGTVYALADDYSELASEIDRVLYATTNYQDPDALEWLPYANTEDGKEWADGEKPMPGYEDILGFSILADIDLADEHKERPLPPDTRETVERAISEYADSFALLTSGRERVFALDSVGGVYLLTPPAATAPIARAFDGEDRQRVFEELRQRADAWLNDVRDDVNAAVPGAKGVFEADLLNQKNRLYKAPLSIHGSIDGVVHPLDIDTGADEPAYEFVPAENVSQSLIDETTAWTTEFTNSDHADAIEHIVARLWPEYVDESDDWQDALESWITDEREREAEQRRKAQKAAEERARRREERDDDLPPFTDATAGDGLGIATNFGDVQAAVDRVDPQQVVRQLCDEYDTDAGRDPPRFEPGYRDSKSGTSCFVDSEKIHDLDDEYPGIGVLDYVARERGYIGVTDTATGEDRAKARDDLRELGFKIPLWTPAKGSTTHDGEEFEEMPFWSMKKAAVALGAFPADGFVEKESDDGDIYLGFPGPESHNNALDAIEDAGLEHGRDYAGRTWDDLPLYNAEGKMSARKTRRAAADLLLRNHEFATPKPQGTNITATPLYHYWPEEGFFERSGGAWVHRHVGRKVPELETRDMNEIVNRVKRASFVERDSFDAGAYDEALINLKNGVYNLDKGELVDHSPDYRFRTSIPRTHNEDAECPNITEFIEEIVPGEKERRTLFEWIGFCLEVGYPIHRFLILYGSGRNGKSVYFRLVREFLESDNVSGVSLDTIASGGFGISALDQNLLNVDTESADTRLGPEELSVVKALTGGDQRQVDVKYEEPFEMKNDCKLAFAANNPPRFEEDTDAVADRLLTIEFPYRFGTDENADKEPVPERQLMRRLTTDEELSGLLNKALEGLQRVRARGYFSIEEGITSRERFEDYQSEADSIVGFANRCLKNGPNFAMPKNAVHSAYKRYCVEHDHTPAEESAFFRQLGRKTGIETHSKRPRIDTDDGSGRTQVLDHLWVTTEGLAHLSRGAREDTLKTIQHMHEGNADYANDLLFRTAIPNDAADSGEHSQAGLPQAERIQTIKDSVSVVCGRSDGDEYAQTDDIVELAAEQGIDESKAEHALDKLRSRGEIYQPVDGQYAVNR